MIVTGRERDDLLTVLRRDTRVDAGELLDILHIVVVTRFIVEVLTLIVLEMGGVIRVIDLAVEDCEYLIITLFESGVEVDDLVLVVIIDVIIFRQSAEHRTVEHVMTVDQIVHAVRITCRVHEQLAAFGVVAIKVGVQVFIVVTGYMHDRIIDDGIVDLDPTEKVVVSCIQRFIVGRELLQFHMSLFVGIVVEELGADDARTYQQHDDRDDSDHDDRGAGALLRSSAARSVTVIVTAARSSAVVVIAASAVRTALRAGLAASAVIVVIIALTGRIWLTALGIVALTRRILLTSLTVIALTRWVLLATLSAVALTRRILLTTLGVITLPRRVLLTPRGVIICSRTARTLIAADVKVAAVIVRVAGGSSAVVVGS